jgi:hypothetical protein
MRARDHSLTAFMGDGPEVGTGEEEQEAAPAAPPASAERSGAELPPVGALSGRRSGDRIPEPPPAYARLVRRLMTIDPEDAFEKVTAGLKEGKQKAHRAEYADVVDQLDEASQLHMLSHQLAASAAVTVSRYEADLEVLQSDMRTQARAALNLERDAAKGGDKKAAAPKQITDADVESRMAGTYPAEYRRLTGLLAEARAAKKFIDALPDQWAARRRELEARVRTVRKG